MSPGLLSNAILSRIKADSGSGGLYSGGAYTTITGAGWNTASGSLARPYIVWEISGSGDDSLTSDDIVRRVVFTAVDEVSRGCDRLDTVWNRLYGDAMLQSGRIPSYGFHRHNVTLATGSTNPLSAVGGMFYLIDDNLTQTDETTVTLTMTFEVRTTAVATSP